jgi:ketol-acid reductoisomerase
MSIDREQLAEQMRGVMQEIQNGGFARALQDEHAAGYPCRPFLEQMLAEDDVLNRTERAYREL